jgi:hypothetical protein
VVVAASESVDSWRERDCLPDDLSLQLYRSVSRSLSMSARLLLFTMFVLPEKKRSPTTVAPSAPPLPLPVQSLSHAASTVQNKAEHHLRAEKAPPLWIIIIYTYVARRSLFPLKLEPCATLLLPLSTVLSFPNVATRALPNPGRLEIRHKRPNHDEEG